MFQTYKWVSHWQATIGSKELSVEPVVLAVIDRDHSVALFPFGVRRLGGVRVLGFLGGAQSDYNVPLVRKAFDTADALKKIWGLTKESLPFHDVCSFNRIPAGLNRTTDAWLEILEAKHATEGCFFELPSTIADLEAKVSSRRRADSKRQLKRLSSMGRLDFRIAETSSEHYQTTKSMISQKKRRYRQTGVRDVFSSQQTQDFYLGLVGKLGQTGYIHVSSVQLNGRILAAHWGAIYRDRYYWLMPSYEGGGWEKYSPGRLLLENTIRWAVENDLRVFDFTVGVEDYKNIWCNKKLLLYEYKFARSSKGKMFLYFQCVITWLKNNSASRKMITTTIAAYRKLFLLD